MRFALSFVAAAAFAPSALAAGGAYMTVPAASTQACAHACDDDGLCISWTFAEQSCALAAVVVTPPEGVAFGLSDRTPEPLRFRNVPTLPPSHDEIPAEAAALKLDKPTLTAPDELDRPVPELLGGPIEPPLAAPSPAKG